MVNIIERTKEEIRLEERAKDLEKIAKEIIPSATINLTNKPYLIVVFDPSSNNMICGVYPDKNKIVLRDRKYFDISLKLAEEYEKNPGEKWTLKKDYNE